ncbi:MAG: hypothetical protein II969_07540 [Anaerolineaceae bacterium]|nr:hypothetical protein [Anaerolineaceae bacterium]
MGNESGEWIMYGLPEDDPECIHNFDELAALIERVGFLPLFRNQIKGFSIEEFANPYAWWTGDEEHDPWEWRKQAARSHDKAYGKFFGGKAGVISLEWLPVFLSYRRNGYDFEDYWFSGRAQFRQKKIMDCLTGVPEMPGWQLKHEAGFGKNGEKNFNGTITALQDMLYVVVSDFRRRKNKYGFDYGWDVSVYARPEEVWGTALITQAYSFSPNRSYNEICSFLKDLCPSVNESQIELLIGKRPE